MTDKLMTDKLMSEELLAKPDRVMPPPTYNEAIAKIRSRREMRDLLRKALMILPWVLIVLGVMAWYVRTVELRFAGMANHMGATEAIVLATVNGPDGKLLSEKYRSTVDALAGVRTQLEKPKDVPKK